MFLIAFVMLQFFVAEIYFIAVCTRVIPILGVSCVGKLPVSCFNLSVGVCVCVCVCPPPTPHSQTELNPAKIKSRCYTGAGNVPVLWDQFHWCCSGGKLRRQDACGRRLNFISALLNVTLLCFQYGYFLCFFRGGRVGEWIKMTIKPNSHCRLFLCLLYPMI